MWEALLAALSIPGLYPPYLRGAQRLVDAVSLTPVPLDAVVEAGADVTIAVNLLGRETLPRWPGDDGHLAPPAAHTGKARDTVVEVLEVAQIDASARQTARADVPVTPRFGPGSWRSMQLGPQYLDAGRVALEVRQPAGARPAAVPVHRDRDVAREILLRHERRLVRGRDGPGNVRLGRRRSVLLREQRLQVGGVALLEHHIGPRA